MATTMLNTLFIGTRGNAAARVDAGLVVAQETNQPMYDAPDALATRCAP